MALRLQITLSSLTKFKISNTGIFRIASHLQYTLYSQHEMVLATHFTTYYVLLVLLESLKEVTLTHSVPLASYLQHLHLKKHNTPERA